MHDACPSCGHFVDVTQGQLTSCPGCGHWWIPGEGGAPSPDAGAPPQAAGPVAEIEDEDDVPASVAPARPAAPVGDPLLALRRATVDRSPPVPAGGAFEFEVQYAEGDQWQGPFDQFGIREMLYVGRLTGDEEIREPGSATHSRLGDRPEFEQVLHLLGKKEKTGAHRHSIAGWKRQPKGAAAAPAAGPSSTAPAPAPASAPQEAAPAPAPAAAPADSSAPETPRGTKGLLIGVGVVLALAALGAVAAFAL